MMWLFAALAVLALGGVAMIAAGLGDPMRAEPPDSVPSGIDHDGPLSAEDLRRVRFGIGLRGYRMDQVDALLDRLAAERDGTGPLPDAAVEDNPRET